MRFFLKFFVWVGVVIIVVFSAAVLYSLWQSVDPGLPQGPDSYACDAAAPAGAWRCLYVASDGSDTSSGTIISPFATLDRARRAARSFGEKWEGDLVILLRGGTYHLSDTVVFGPKDSGKNGHRLVIQPYENEAVTLSGGVPIGGWEGPFENGMYATTAVPVEFDFRHLVVNGRRAQRARHPNSPAFNAIAAWDRPTVVPTSECPQEPFGKRLGVRDEDVWFVDELEQAHLSRVEVFAERYGGSAILRIDSVGQANEAGTGIRYITPKSPERDRLFGPNGNCSWQIDRLAFYFENSSVFLDESGEWFLDTVTTPEAPVLYYKPRSGEDLASTTVIVPRLETLLRFSGTERNRVHDVAVRGLNFTGTTWGLPGNEGLISLYPGSDYRDNTGYWDAYLHPAALHLEGTERITLERNVLHALGGMGIDLYDHTKDTLVDGNAILEVAGAGIMVDGEGFVGTWRTFPEVYLPFPRAGEPRSSGDRITNNRIQRYGIDVWQSPGIAAAYPWNMAVEHNEISESYSSGFWIGWYGPWARCHESMTEGSLPKLKHCQASTGKNRVVGNRIFNIGGLLIDGGGIYTLGHQSPTDTLEDGMEIRGNHVFGMRRLTATFPTAFGALYLDGDTSFTRVIDNIFEVPQASSTIAGAFGMFGEVASIFLNPDEATSVPPHDVLWSATGAQEPPGDNVSDPALKPRVRETAGLLPPYRNIPSLEGFQ